MFNLLLIKGEVLLSWLGLGLNLCLVLLAFYKFGYFKKKSKKDSDSKELDKKFDLKLDRTEFEKHKIENKKDIEHANMMNEEINTLLTSIPDKLDKFQLSIDAKIEKYEERQEKKFEAHRAETTRQLDYHMKQIIDILKK